MKNMELTKRLELSFLNVFALPKASRIGLVFNISYSIPLPPPRAAKYCIAFFAVSVFPAPLSPLRQQTNEIELRMLIKTLKTCVSLVCHVMCYLLDDMHHVYCIIFEKVKNWLKEHKR